MGKSIGYVYQDGCGSVCFQIGSLCLSFLASGILTDILGVSTFDTSGYVEIDTNYGLEFFDFAAALKGLGLEGVWSIPELMSSVSSWKVINTGFPGLDRKDVGLLMERAFLILNGLAFDIVLYNSTKLLRVVDLQSTEHRANFYYNGNVGYFSVVDSTFPDSKRKYEMLFLVERNTPMLREALERAG